MGGLRGETDPQKRLSMLFEAIGVDHEIVNKGGELKVTAGHWTGKGHNHPPYIYEIFDRAVDFTKIRASELVGRAARIRESHPLVYTNLPVAQVFMEALMREVVSRGGLGEKIVTIDCPC